MTQAPTDKKKQEDKGNIFTDFLYNLFIQMPVLLIAWVISLFDWD